MKVIQAQVMDATHLELSTPIQVPRGSTVVISIAAPEVDKEHDEWVRMSIQGLQTVYVDDEPDYSLSRVNTPNPEYVSAIERISG